MKNGTKQEIFITKATGHKELFDVSKLEHSLQRVHASPDIIQKISEHIIQELEDGMSTHEIYNHAFTLLRKFEKPVATRYSLRRAIMDLGPTGFPFERFIAEIYGAQGYEAVTDQIVYGGCVEHEIDIVAWKGDELLMAEAKFHHQLGLKSDLKVVLYVKARFDDLAQGKFTYGNKERVLTKGLLITNTKFTVSAIKYAECQNLTIIGWNYPANGSLHQMIESANLHPLTCLSSLSDHDKKALLEKNIILCKALEENPSHLSSIGLTEVNIEVVLEEIRGLKI